MKGFVKDPNATLDYAFDWSPWLGTDTIATSQWTIEPSGLSVVPASETIFDNDTKTRVFVTGGALKEDYVLTNTITTNASRTDERSVQISVRDR